MGKVLDCDIWVSEFELPLSYNIHIRINTLGKSMNILFPEL